MGAAQPGGNSSAAAAGDLIFFPLEDGLATFCQLLEFLCFRVVDGSATLVGIDRFGASAPGGLVLKKMGFTVNNIVKQALKIIN